MSKFIALRRHQTKFQEKIGLLAMVDVLLTKTLMDAVESRVDSPSHTFIVAKNAIRAETC